MLYVFLKNAYTMITKSELREVSEKALYMIDAAGIQLSETESAKTSAADFRLSCLKKEGIHWTSFQIPM